MVEVMTETFFPAAPIKIGVQYIMYSLYILGARPEERAMKAGYGIFDKYRLLNGTYKISSFKSVSAFKPGKKNEANKWITFYAYRAKGN